MASEHFPNLKLSWRTQMVLRMLEGDDEETSGYGEFYESVGGVTVKTEAEKLEAAVPAASQDAIADVTAYHTGETQAQGAWDYIEPLPTSIPKNAVFQAPAVEQVSVQTYSAPTPVLVKGAAPHAGATTYGDMLLKTAHQALRREGSLVGSASVVMGVDALSAPEASIMPWLTQARMAELNMESGFVPSGTIVGNRVAVVPVAGYEQFMLNNPGYKPLYAPEMQPAAFAAWVALMRDGGVGAYTWAHLDQRVVEVPINSLRRYPTGYADEIAVVVQDGSNLLAPRAVDHTAITLPAVRELLKWYETWCKAGPLMVQARKDAAALSYGYYGVDVGITGSAGPGMRMGNPVRTVDGREGQGVARTPRSDEYYEREGGGNETVGVLPRVRVERAIGVLWRRFVLGGIPEYAIPRLPDETDDEYEARIRRAALDLGRSGGEEFGVVIHYYLGGAQQVRLPWGVVQALVEESDPNDAGVRAVRDLLAAYVWPAAAVDEDVNREALGDRALFNVYGQWFGVAVYYPEPRLDGVLAVFAGLSTLLPQQGQESRTGVQAQLTGARLLAVMRKYAVKLHLMHVLGLQDLKMDYTVLTNRGVRGPVLARAIPEKYMSLVLPADCVEAAYPHEQVLPFESGYHLQRAKASTPYVGMRVEGGWKVEGGAVSRGAQGTIESVRAFDCAFRRVYQSGGRLANGVRAANDVIVMRTYVPGAAAGAAGRSAYHAGTVPFRAVAGGRAFDTALVLVAHSGAGADVLGGVNEGGRQVAFTGNG